MWQCYDCVYLSRLIVGHVLTGRVDHRRNPLFAHIVVVKVIVVCSPHVINVHVSELSQAGRTVNPDLVLDLTGRVDLCKSRIFLFT